MKSWDRLPKKCKKSFSKLRSILSHDLICAPSVDNPDISLIYRRFGQMITRILTPIVRLCAVTNATNKKCVFHVHCEKFLRQIISGSETYSLQKAIMEQWTENVPFKTLAIKPVKCDSIRFAKEFLNGFSFSQNCNLLKLNFHADASKSRILQRIPWKSNYSQISPFFTNH